MYFDSGTRAALCDGPLVGPLARNSFQGCGDMHAGAGRPEFQQLGKHPGLTQERQPALVIDSPRLTQMPREMPLFYECCESSLCQNGRMPVGNMFGVHER